MFRIAVGGIATESCTFSPLPTRLSDFILRRGQEVLDAYPFLSKSEAEYLPILHARALPGGSVETATYLALKHEFLDKLEAALPLDGLFLDMHGAMNVAGMDDAEGDWITAARQIVGADCLISGSFDLHGNISVREAAALDMLSAFRTAPHIDYMETRERAFGLLVRALTSGVRPHVLRLPVPVVLPGEKTSTEWEPGASLYATLAEQSAVPGVWDASIFVGYVWADEPRASATIEITGTDDAAMRREAETLARRYWDARDKFAFGVQSGTIDECIAWALAAPEMPVIISDSGDNPTAGGAGDVPIFLERLIAHDVPDAVVACIGDAPATEICYKAGVGAEVELRLGGKLDPVTSKPLPVKGTVKFLLETDEMSERQAVVQVGGVLVIVAQRRRPFHYISDFQKLGIEPSEHKLIVVKVGYLVPELKAAAAKAFLALSPGAVDQDIERLPFQRMTRPMYPLDKGMTWTP
ncbi:MAG: M81 family metallopeptidase [Anaerolineae bacterium]|nr:M81 family metallopeptidase [Anaerolineae bacterium]